MTLEELETKLVQANVIPAVAKLISMMALSPSIERHKKSWAIPLGLVIVPNSARQRQRSFELIMKAVIVDQKGTIYHQFSIIAELTTARGNAYLSYCFTTEFIEWAGLTQNAPAQLH